ncbi:MAG: GNAT family N-acetyltransferase [Flavobacteriaceae bacterium]|jgi:ribosomal-protein-alanine N-acetyltransferase|nr:GNAT family N-acetyltransferase [Flavobacteriaceae bacterium]MBT3920070.1 GNAT family N-acetyltransferase [Flavobacteriaceae bacterium]MBT7242643.1 GNAT family N-acetyltransferase [Flavobacteriaceae bacterium]|tara:strand:+ start:80 stop:616 length:537 start_codon:yes stop_codon:yes gene_type:complete
MNNTDSLTSFPILTSERLMLRNVLYSDFLDILNLRSNELVTQYIDRPKMKTEEEALKFIFDRKKDNAENKVFYWGIMLKSTKKLIGTICLWNISEDRTYAEIGYDLIPEYHRKGYMNEAIINVVEFGFKESNFKTIEAFTSFKNNSSIKLLEKNNFILQKDRRDEGFPNNRIYMLKSN